jgi:hypothetical protein
MFSSEGGSIGRPVVVCIKVEVGQIDVASFCVAVPLVHGVYGFAQLSFAAFVDVNIVDPDILEAVAAGHGANFVDLGQGRGVLSTSLKIVNSLKEISSSSPETVSHVLQR